MVLGIENRIEMLPCAIVVNEKHELWSLLSRFKCWCHLLEAV